MKLKRKYLLLSAIILFLVTLLFKREVTFYAYTDTTNYWSDFRKEHPGCCPISFFGNLYINEEKVISDTIGLHGFGYKTTAVKLRGGIHRLRLTDSNDDVILEKRFIVLLNQHYVIALWTKENGFIPRTENRFFRKWRFE